MTIHSWPFGHSTHHQVSYFTQLITNATKINMIINKSGQNLKYDKWIWSEILGQKLGYDRWIWGGILGQKLGYDSLFLYFLVFSWKYLNMLKCVEAFIEKKFEKSLSTKSQGLLEKISFWKIDFFWFYLNVLFFIFRW
jgi:hypothetical protein